MVWSEGPAVCPLIGTFRVEKVRNESIIGHPFTRLAQAVIGGLSVQVYTMMVCFSPKKIMSFMHYR